MNRQLVMDDAGKVLDARFSAGWEDSGFAIYFDSRSGSAKKNGRNLDYPVALRLLLQRLASVNAVIEGIWVHTERTLRDAVPLDACLLRLETTSYPIVLSRIRDFEALRKDITGNPMRAAGGGDTGGRTGPGAQRALRLAFSVPGYSSENVSEIRDILERGEALALQKSYFDLIDAHKDGFIPNSIPEPFGSDETDGMARRPYRKEQQYLRGLLFPGGPDHPANCELCGRIYPSRFLVAAHVKPRSNCSPEEKRDPAIVMRACLFGCDILYEHGYFHVDADGILRLTVQDVPATILEYARVRVGRRAPGFSQARSEYFAWHRKVRAGFLGGVSE